MSFCPHDLFPNTKFDMGTCVQRHDEFFKRQFMVMAEDDRYKFERDYIDETIGEASCNRRQIRKTDLLD